jgi:hypothetical protein
VINDYLNNKKDFFTKKTNDNKITRQLKLSPKSKVDINKLLNRVKIEKKKKRKENLVIIGLVGCAITIIGIISLL